MYNTYIHLDFRNNNIYRNNYPKSFSKLFNKKLRKMIKAGLILIQLFDWIV
jgi:hypothetical protein